MRTKTVDILITNPNINGLSEQLKEKYMRYNGYILKKCSYRSFGAIFYAVATNYNFEHGDFIDLDCWMVDVDNPTEEEVMTLRMMYPFLRMNEDNTEVLHVVSLGSI